MASPTAVQNGDMLLDFIISGHDGSNFRTVAMIEAVVDGAVTGGGAADMPTRLEFQVQADGAGGWLGDGASTPEMVIKSNGAVGIGTATPNAGAKLDVAGPIFLDGLNDGSTEHLLRRRRLALQHRRRLGGARQHAALQRGRHLGRHRRLPECHDFRRQNQSLRIFPGQHKTALQVLN